jgi:hypothetical protein
MAGQGIAATLMAVAVVVSAGCKDKDKPPPPPAGEPKPAAPPPTPPPPDASSSPADARHAAAPSGDFHTKVDPLVPVIRKITLDASVVSATKDQNAKKISMEAIQKLDKQWIATSGVADFMKPYINNKCADAVRRQVKTIPAVVEAFVMDNQGGLVCTVEKTTDYWQGDEDKWQKAVGSSSPPSAPFLDGKGADFIDKPQFDDSSQVYTVQISLPIMEKDHAIGAITVGLALDKL